MYIPKKDGCALFLGVIFIILTISILIGTGIVLMVDSTIKSQEEQREEQPTRSLSL